MKLRPLEPADFPAVHALYNATSAREIEGGLMDERAFLVDYYEPPPPWIDAGLVLEWESTIAGALLARRAAGHEALRAIRLVAMDEDAATELARAALDVARRHGLALVEGSGAAAVEVAGFEGAGFEATGAVIEMRRDLAALPPLPPRAGALAEAHDAEAARLVTAAFAESEERPTTSPEQVAVLRAEGAAVGVRDAAGKLVAFAAVKRSGGEPHVGEIHLVSVDPAAQGKGYGKAVMVACLHAIRDLGLREAWLATWSENQSALGLYERVGFRETKRIPWFEKRV